MPLASDLPQALKQAVAQPGWPGRDAPLLVAVSGGPDSSALLLALLRLTEHPLHVAHIDHGMRPDAGEDAAWVAELAASLSLPCSIHRLPSPPRQETEARIERHEALATLARQLGIPAIALGHHADDQAETLLLRMLRGTTPDGLAGMTTVSAGMAGATLLRPLLGCTRAAIGAWLDTQSLPSPPRRDPSNEDPDHTPRNRLRLELTTGLDRIQPRWVEALCRLAERLGDDREALDTSAREALADVRRSGRDDLDLTSLMALPRAVRRRVLAHGFPALETLAQERILTWLDEGHGSHLHLRQHVAWVRDGRLAVLPPMAETLASCRLCLTPPPPRPSMPEGQSPPDFRVS